MDTGLRRDDAMAQRSGCTFDGRTASTWRTVSHRKAEYLVTTIRPGSGRTTPHPASRPTKSSYTLRRRNGISVCAQSPRGTVSSFMTP